MKKDNYRVDGKGPGENNHEASSTPEFALDRKQILETGRIVLGDWTDSLFGQVSQSVERLSQLTYSAPIQRGRVVALRQTDVGRYFSAFKAALYHANYDDMQNIDRLFDRIISSHHSYEPLRGENILFLYVGVSKSVYDALAMFSHGRPTRITGGSRHSIPWGIECPDYGIDRKRFIEENMGRVRAVAELANRSDLDEEERAKLVVAYNELPVCYLMAPFVFEFSEEALVTKVFKQRLWEKGVENRDTAFVMKDMWECCLALDRQKFETLYEYHGPHVVQWEDGIRELRKSNMSVDLFIDLIKTKASEITSDSEKMPEAYEVLIRCLSALSEDK